MNCRTTCHYRRLGTLLGLIVGTLATATLPTAVLAGTSEPTLSEDAILQRDWRMQDGIGTALQPANYRDATQRTLKQGDRLLQNLQSHGVSLAEKPAEWKAMWATWKALSAQETEPADWEAFWLRLHRLRRAIVFANPLARIGPLAFIKQAPSTFSHQLTQYTGRYAKPGGGIFVLDTPGQSMQCRPLAAGALPLGSYQHLDISYDGRRFLFSYCKTDSIPPSGIVGTPDRRFHLYKMDTDGSHVRQLTNGPYDDFSPRRLPNGQIVFISTRRGGWHRCGGSPGHGCENFTLALAESDGSNPRTVSFHETQEWDPAVLNDGRVIYTRWDYVDRHAVYYEQLWTVRPDGTSPAIFFGNNTLNPVGIWEAVSVPGSNRVMATAAGHHAMTAGSIILVDVNRGVDGRQSITRLTPDALFPESEAPMAPRNWHAPAGLSKPPTVPVDARRWPGHCYRTPFPLSETYFLAAYSFDPLLGEPASNHANMFGLYLVDVFGNKELLHRDPAISSLWPVPIRPHYKPPHVSNITESPETGEGTFVLQSVYFSSPPIPPGTIKQLRIVQVLPKTTAGANYPPVGIPNASPGKQVLGTVPVEPDGSAHFRAPANIPLAFQALDEQGRAVQIMRSLTYLQPGETISCVGCHEPRTTTPPQGAVVQALGRPPSTIRPGPDGSKPLSYPLLVQPVLDNQCVRCHNDKKAEGNVVLTGQPEGHYTRSYNALARRVTYSAWGGRSGDFRRVNNEPLTTPGFFGAISSPIMNKILDGKHFVHLTSDEIDRLVTWMDANVLFYGTFDPADQARQRKGERIAGPKLE